MKVYILTENKAIGLEEWKLVAEFSDTVMINDGESGTLFREIDSSISCFIPNTRTFKTE